MIALQDTRTLAENTDSSSFYKKTLLRFNTVPVKEKKAEFHKHYIDIHVVLQGEEYVEVGHVEHLIVTESYNEETDIGFGQLLADKKLYEGQLKPGYFLICFPEDAHVVGAHTEIESEVTKLVYKICINED